MLSRNETVSHIETHIELKLLPLQHMKLSWKCFIQNHWRAFRPQTSHHKSQKIQSYHLPMLPETSNISASKWRLTSLSKCAASLGSVESNSIFGASSKENLTRSGSQSCCIFPVKEIDFTTRLKHPLAFPTLKNTMRPKVAWVLKFAKPDTVCLKHECIMFLWVPFQHPARERNRNGHGPPESKVPECLWSRSSIDPSAFAKNNESCVWKFE